MTKAEQVGLVTWRSKFLQYASAENRTVSQTCRFFGISRKTYYKWANRRRTHGDAGLCDRARVAQRFPRATPAEAVSKIYGAPPPGQARRGTVAGQSEVSGAQAALATL